MSRFIIRRWYIDSQGYDRDGRYWGIGEKLWEMEDNETGKFRYTRAKDKHEAIVKFNRGESSARENPWTGTDSWILGGLLASGAVALIAWGVTSRVNPSFTSGTSTPSTTPGA